MSNCRQKCIFANIFFPSVGIASLANSYKDLLSSDANAQYDQLIELNLSQVNIVCFSLCI